MNATGRRVAINLGGGYVPGLNSVITGAVLAASNLGWEVVGIKDGFNPLLFPERYPVPFIPLTPSLVESLAVASGPLLGTKPRTDPFRGQVLDSSQILWLCMNSAFSRKG